MTNEEWNDDTNFVDGKTSIEYLYGLDKITEQISLRIVVEKSGEKRRYEPLMFIDILLSSQYNKIDKTKSLSKKLVMLYDAKAFIIHYIQSIVQELNDAPPSVKKYDFSGKVAQIDSIIEKIRSEKEEKRKRIEVIVLVSNVIISILTIGFSVWFHHSDSSLGDENKKQIKELQLKLQGLKNEHSTK